MPAIIDGKKISQDIKDELKEQVEKLEEIIYPKVVKTLVEDKVFDFNDLFSHEGCGGSC